MVPTVPAIPTDRPDRRPVHPGRSRVGADGPVRGDRLDPTASLDFVGFVAVHLVALLGGLAVGCPLRAVLVGAASYLVRAWAVAAGAHRYFSHRAYRLGRLGQLVLAVLATLAVPKGLLWWVGHHRAHHRRAVAPEAAVGSEGVGSEGVGSAGGQRPPAPGLVYRHLGWAFDPATQPVDRAGLADWLACPELRWLQRHRLVPVAGFGVALWLTTGPAGFVWGWALSTVALWHVVLASGRLPRHLGGYRRFDTPDASRNSRLLSALLLGDGWQNNHHHAPASARHGIGWREPDPVWWSLLALEGMGLAWGLRDTMPRRPPVGERALVPAPVPTSR